jgi:hypothetical protein
VSLLPSEEGDESIGMIYPLIPHHAERFFKGKTVFVKFVRVVPARLHIGSRLFFYMSGGSREIIGDARIVKMTTATAGEVSEKYADQLFLTADELEEYVGDRWEKSMLVLSLSNARKYHSPLKLPKYVTMAGQYMTRQWYESLTKTG